MKPISHKFVPTPGKRDECALCGNRESAHTKGPHK